MINTSDFKTKTEIIDRKNLSFSSAWPVAIDIGYSAVKGFSPNKAFRFPSYARLVEGDVLSIGQEADDEFLYQDLETGEIWAVGENAIKMIMSNDTQDSIESLYGRNRYYSPMFKVLFRVGLALSIMPNSYGNQNNRPIYLQTGLPPKYLKSDSGILTEVLTGRHHFKFCQGSKGWKEYDIEISKDRIEIIPQPMGTLFSIASDNEGNQIKDAANYFKKRTLIFDPGFGTLDLFNVTDGVIKGSETSDTLGMKAVLLATCNKIYKKHGVEISVPRMQQVLAKGKFKKFNRLAKETEYIDFSDILERASLEICDKAISHMDSIYNYLSDYDYLVITGGTGEAWEAHIREVYRGMEDSLKIISGNQNDNLSYTFSNVRGYYMLLCNKLKLFEKKKGACA